ncbi:MAG: TerD family protein [Pseudomonadota bacterium]
MSDPNFPDPKDFDKQQDENFNENAETGETPEPETGFPTQPAPEEPAVDKDEEQGPLQKILLNEVDPGMRQVKVALGWDGPEKTENYDLDLDACVFMLNRNNRVRDDKDFIFYNNLSSEDGFILHSGDNKDGLGAGDNEIIDIQLDQVSFDVEKFVFTISIHNADERFQTFKDINSGFIRVVNRDTDEEIARFELSEETSNTTAFRFAEIARNDAGGWAFNLLLEPHPEGLYGIARDYGVNVAEP